MRIEPLKWQDGKLKLLDQTKLPLEEVYLELSRYPQVIEAIKNMRVRGAPAIAVAAVYGLALAAQSVDANSQLEFRKRMKSISKEFAATRPTGHNLFYALKRMEVAIDKGSRIEGIRSSIFEEAGHIAQEVADVDWRVAQSGAELIEDGFTVLTHCNAGALATAGYGTVMGMIGEAYEQGKRIGVFVDETRPLLQGARLTAWELVYAGIPATLITDNMAGHFMKQGKIDCVVVGADRVAANGDVANKIGTYSVAVLARENSVPFYVTVPTSTIDLSLPSGEVIPIEERSSEEVTHIQDSHIAPDGVNVANPAFDVTPTRYLTAIITENGIVREPTEDKIRGLFSG